MVEALLPALPPTVMFTLPPPSAQSRVKPVRVGGAAWLVTMTPWLFSGRA